MIKVWIEQCFLFFLLISESSCDPQLILISKATDLDLNSTFKLFSWLSVFISTPVPRLYFFLFILHYNTNQYNSLNLAVELSQYDPGTMLWNAQRSCSWGAVVLCVGLLFILFCPPGLVKGLLFLLWLCWITVSKKHGRVLGPPAGQSLKRQ